MDIADLKINLDAQHRGKVFFMLNADGRPTSFGMRILGPDSDAMKRAKLRIRDRHLTKKKVTASDIDDDTLDILCAVVVGWEGLTKEGRELPFSSKMLREILTEYPVIRDHLLRAHELIIDEVL